jgi:hypothetical protein
VGDLTRVPISRGGIRISHLLFADDSLILPCEQVGMGAGACPPIGL